MTGRLPAGDGGHSLLPASPTRLVGRERERRAARDLLMLEHVRLLTLTGPGGSGKTRLALAVTEDLALAVTEDLAPTFADGVRLVDLTPLREPSLVVPAIARAFGVHESGRRPIAEVLFERLQTERVLLVLDNCEHLLEAAPAIARR